MTTAAMLSSHVVPAAGSAPSVVSPAWALATMAASTEEMGSSKDMGTLLEMRWKWAVVLAQGEPQAASGARGRSGDRWGSATRRERYDVRVSVAAAGNERCRGRAATGTPRNRVSTTNATAASSPRTKNGWRPIPAIR